jgi:hypothetical protein
MHLRGKLRDLDRLARELTVQEAAPAPSAAALEPGRDSAETRRIGRSNQEGPSGPSWVVRAAPRD